MGNDLLFGILTLWLFVYGGSGVIRFLRIPNMWLVLLIVAFFLLTGSFWASLVVAA